MIGFTNFLRSIEPGLYTANGAGGGTGISARSPLMKRIHLIGKYVYVARSGNVGDEVLERRPREISSSVNRRPS